MIVARPPSALLELCGILLLERVLRNLQRLGFREATIVSREAKLLAETLARPSWPRAEIALAILSSGEANPRLSEIVSHGERSRILLLAADTYVEPRLINALLGADGSAVLIDSKPPGAIEPLLSPRAEPHCVLPAAIVERASTKSVDTPFLEWLHAVASSGSLASIDVEQQDRYLVNLRRNLRPIWFPAPSPQHCALAENLLLNAAQNGTLDLPAIVHAPIETAIVRRLCRTNITPMQITLFTAAVSAVVTLMFASGRLLTGTCLALVVGVLDGLDGKQARVKVETTELGKREHVLDYVLELSWWTALAYHLASTQQLAGAYALVLLLVGSDLIDRYAKRVAKQVTGRNLDDVAPIDRFVRLIGGRRNIYIWLLAIGVASGAADKAFALLCYWGAGTAAVHMLRAIWIARQPRRA